MKKLTALLLAFVLILSFAACGSDGDTEKELARGVIDGDVYKSDYTGLQFTKPAEWVYSTDEEIAAAMNIGAEALGDQFAETLATLTTVYDMMVIDPTTGTNVSIAYENLTLSGAADMTNEEYLEAMKTQMAAVESMQIVFGEPGTVSLGDGEYLRVLCTTTLNEMSVEQVYYLRNIDGYMNFIIVTLAGDYDAAAVEAMFK